MWSIARRRCTNPDWCNPSRSTRKRYRHLIRFELDRGGSYAPGWHDPLKPLIRRFPENCRKTVLTPLRSNGPKRVKHRCHPGSGPKQRSQNGQKTDAKRSQNGPSPHQPPNKRSKNGQKTVSNGSKTVKANFSSILYTYKELKDGAAEKPPPDLSFLS